MSLSFSKTTEKNVEMTSIILNVYIKYFGCQDTTSTLKIYYMQSYFDLLEHIHFEHTSKTVSCLTT